MNRTMEQLADLISYEKVRALPLLNPPAIEKHDIPHHLACPSFGKAMNKVQQALEKYDRKISSIESDIAAQDQLISRSKSETWHPFGLDRTNHAKVQNHNHWVEVGSKAIDKRNDLVDKHSEVAEERKERNAELMAEALLAIDDDVVAVLDKCNRVAEKLSTSANSEDLVAALEVSLIELKIYGFTEDKIEGNTARKDARERIAEATRNFVQLCANPHVFNYLSDLLRRNAHVMQTNAGLHEQILATINSIDQPGLDRANNAMEKMLGESFPTEFGYQGVIDPEELQSIITRMEETIAAEQDAIKRLNEFHTSTAEIGSAAVTAQMGINGLIATMNANLAPITKDMRPEGHFAREMLSEAVIDDFSSKEVRSAIGGLRTQLAAAVGEQWLDAILGDGDDLFTLKRAAAASEGARLMRFQSTRARVSPQVERLKGMVQAAHEGIREAEQVPQRNASALRASLTTAYRLALLPWMGIYFATAISKKMREYEPAFRSPVQVYRALGVDLVRMNAVMLKAMLIAGGILVVAGTGSLFAINGAAELGVNLGVPASLLASYLLSAAFVKSAGTNLGVYLALPSGSEAEVRALPPADASGQGG